MNDIKKEILEQFEEEVIVFLEGQDDKLVGYAEMFGNPCILIYQDINFIPLSPDDAIEKIQKINPCYSLKDTKIIIQIAHPNLAATTKTQQRKKMTLSSL